jgi:cell division transport system permease protein
LVIGIALALPACLQVLIVNARTASGDLNRAVELSVYFKPGTPAEHAEKTALAVRARGGIANVQLVKADEALRAFRERAGFGAALDALTDNPLPHTLIVRPEQDQSDRTRLEELATDLRALPEIDLVQLDSVWIDRLNAILDTLRRTVWVVALLLGFGVLITIGNTIRAEIQARRAEIEITKLVGGTNAFVRRPFLYTGFWYGLAGGILALGISYLVVALLAGPIGRLAGLYGSDFKLAGLGFEDGSIVVATGIILGWLGALLAATRHLREIEPQ